MPWHILGKNVETCSCLCCASVWMKPGLVEQFLCRRFPGGCVSVKGGFKMSLMHFHASIFQQFPKRKLFGSVIQMMGPAHWAVLSSAVSGRMADLLYRGAGTLSSHQTPNILRGQVMWEWLNCLTCHLTQAGRRVMSPRDLQLCCCTNSLTIHTVKSSLLKARLAPDFYINGHCSGVGVANATERIHCLYFSFWVVILGPVYDAWMHKEQADTQRESFRKFFKK